MMTETFIPWRLPVEVRSRMKCDRLPYQSFEFLEVSLARSYGATILASAVQPTRSRNRLACPGRPLVWLVSEWSGAVPFDYIQDGAIRFPARSMATPEVKVF